MKEKRKWPLVVLISSLQLAILLLSVVFLFDWFDERTNTTMQKQVVSDNHTIAQQAIVAAGLSRVASGYQEGDPASLGKVKRHIKRVQVPNNGQIALISADGKRVIASNTKMESQEINWGELNLTNSNQSMKLADSISTTSRLNGGQVETKAGVFYVSTDLIPGDDAVLVVAQDRSRIIRDHASVVAIMRKIVFGVALLLGFFCVGYTTTILSRFNEQVSDANQQLEKQVTRKTRELFKTQNAIIFGLAKLAESRDNDTGEHLDRIRTYVMILAKDLASQFPILDDEFIHNLALASSLHDIGKVGIPDSILLKPGRLTPEERSVMEFHTVIGGECLDAIQERLGDNEFMQIARKVTYSHHERWDGNGYPHKLAGGDIPLVARIVSVADVYDALTSKRPYKRAMSHFESKTIILSGAGTQFDPEVVAAFLRHEDEFEAISIAQQELSDEQSKSDFQRMVEQFSSSDKSVKPL